MAKDNTNRKTRKQLKRILLESNASCLLSLKHSHNNLNKAGTDARMGSGVVVTITAIGGAEITPVFMITDGLSQATIDALRADIQRTSDLAQSPVYALPISQSNKS